MEKKKEEERRAKEIQLEEDERQEEERRQEEYFQQVLEFAKGVGEDEDLQTATAIAMSLAEGKEIDKSEQKEWDELVGWSQADGESEGDEDILFKKAIALSLEKDGDLTEGEQPKQSARRGHTEEEEDEMADACWQATEAFRSRRKRGKRGSARKDAMLSIEKIKREGHAEENHKRFLFALRSRKYVYLFVVTASRICRKF